MGMMRKCIVVSAVNIIEGGTLTVLRDCLASAALSLPSEWEIIALVHDQKLVDQPRVRFIEIPDAKRSWLRRLYHEWIDFRRLSRELEPDLWLSLHDITPRVITRRQAVYCHNPSPFYQLPLREAWLEPKLWLFNNFYQYLYRAFIRRNQWVIVQQGWLRVVFEKMYGKLPIVVAHPSVTSPSHSKYPKAAFGKVVFFYPALPRVFKNFEVICEAAKILSSRGVLGFEIRMTLSGRENSYSKWLYKKYANVFGVLFIGLQNKIQMGNHYHEASAVLFPSRLETWGLPISEAKLYKKPLLVADLPYAHETVGSYNHVSFFHPADAAELANLMQSIIENNWHPEGAKMDEPSKPFTRNWDELWRLLSDGL
jgi:glycosyltransferase involved in cell wall biosynthesis